MQQPFQTLVAQLQAKLIFTLGMKAAMALATSRIGRTTEWFFDVNLGWKL
jgi:hypothetical protein